ncbi:MAG: tetratricopeptide repeat protein, partial [Proteobacteria bacterium]|jgi:tetratricopeptide (TPR) repeat protein|nr:tetratricopeptide repeat protein [Pseudomonadota bacterium]
VIFAAHPLAAEIVGMAANVSDHLALAFMAVQILVLDGHRERGGAWRLVAAGLLGCLACGSKEIGVTSALAPAVALLLARASGGAVVRRDWLRVGWWAASVLPVALYLALRAYVTSRAGWAATAWPPPEVLALSLGIGPGLALQGIGAPIPSGANVYTTPGAVLPWALAVVAWAGIAVAVARPLWRRSPPGLASIGVALALAWLVPSLLGVDRFSDEDPLRFPTRYLHLPLAGLLLAVLPAAARIWNRGLRFAAPVVAVLLVVLSWLRVEEWQDEVSFFTAEAAYHPESMPDQINAISAFVHVHAFAAAEEAIARAESRPQARAARARSRLLNERAAILVLRDGDTDAATRLLREAIAAWPDDLGNVLDLASVRMTAGQPEQAVAILDDALASPRFDDYRRAAIDARRRKYLGALGGTPPSPRP